MIGPHAHRPRPRALVAAIVALAAVLAACGSTTQVGSDRMLQVALTEYHVAPQSVRAPAGTLTIFVHNYGRLSHNLVISRTGQPEVDRADPPGGDRAGHDALARPVSDGLDDPLRPGAGRLRDARDHVLIAAIAGGAPAAANSGSIPGVGV